MENSTIKQYIHPQTLTGILSSRDQNHDNMKTIQADYNLDNNVASKISWRLGLLQQDQTQDGKNKQTGNVGRANIDSLEYLEQDESAVDPSIAKNLFKLGLEKETSQPSIQSTESKEEGGLKESTEPIGLNQQIDGIFDSLTTDDKYNQVRKPVNKSVAKKVRIDV